MRDRGRDRLLALAAAESVPSLPARPRTRSRIRQAPRIAIRFAWMSALTALAAAAAAVAILAQIPAGAGQAGYRQHPYARTQAPVQATLTGMRTFYARPFSWTGDGTAR